MSARGVVHVCKVAGIAGAENHLLRLLPGLAERGFDVHLLVLGSHTETKDFRDRLAETGIPSDRVSIRLPLDPMTVVDLSRRLRVLRPALVHTHLIHADVHGQAAAQLADVPFLISSRHNTDPFRRWTAVRFLDGRVMRRVDLVIAISGAVARFVVEVEGADPAKVRTVPYGLDSPTAQPGANEGTQWSPGPGHHGKVVGFFGRAVRQKGIDVLLDAFPNVLAAHPTARLVIVGDGQERPELERHARRLGIGGAVEFKGWVDRADALMPACDVVVIPSRWEGFGMVALEAMAAARPVVASRVDALEEIVVDGVTGLLVKPDDPASLAAALSRLLADPASATAFGLAGLQRLRRRYTVSRMVDATAAVYRELVPTASPPEPREI